MKRKALFCKSYILGTCGLLKGKENTCCMFKYLEDCTLWEPKKHGKDIQDKLVNTFMESLAVDFKACFGAFRTKEIKDRKCTLCHKLESCQIASILNVQ